MQLSTLSIFAKNLSPLARGTRDENERDKELLPVYPRWRGEHGKRLVIKTP
ncbi:hypothetical protein IG698_004408 [Salmonella enterica]|nr:hypothetical protein [Salmonella enterica]EGI9085544.1 hypothetical protein [Salmonella enterica]